MTNNSQSNRLPIFGRDIVDDWSWDREEEEMREANESDSDNEENHNYSRKVIGWPSIT